MTDCWVFLPHPGKRRAAGQTAAPGCTAAALPGEQQHTTSSGHTKKHQQQYVIISWQSLCANAATWKCTLLKAKNKQPLKNSCGQHSFKSMEKKMENY